MGLPPKEYGSTSEEYGSTPEEFHKNYSVAIKECIQAPSCYQAMQTQKNFILNLRKIASEWPTKASRLHFFLAKLLCSDW